MNDIKCYKDANPSDTIMRIKDIFKNLGYEVREIINEPINNIYSVSINICSTSIFANGKGITKEFARASAYGEMIERLQNFLHFRLCDSHTNFDKEDILYFKNDKKLSESEYKINITKWLGYVLEKENLALNKQILSEATRKNYRNSSRFKNFSDCKMSLYLPYYLLDFYYGSNGMAAGNSFEEAMIQSLCEIAERYVLKMLVNNEFEKLYYIDRFECLKLESLNDYIEAIEENEIIIKFIDFGYVVGLPVIGGLYLDKKNLNYFFNVGSHPKIEVAIVRSITEFLQGRDLDEIKDMTKIYKDFMIHANSVKNYESIFKTGEGCFPYTIFNCEFQKKLSPIWNNNLNKNSEMMYSLINLYKSLGRNIYYTDQGFLGFPCVHVIIPGISEVAKTDLETYVMYKDKKSMLQSYSNIVNNNYSSEDIDKMISCWSSKNISDSTPFIRSIRIPLYIKSDMIFEYISKHYILMVLHILKSNYTSAYHHGYYWLENQHVENGIIKQLFDYVQNLTFILYLLSKGEENYHTFKCIHKELFTQEMAEAYGDIISKNIHNLLPYICCNHCENCDFYGSCKWLPEKMLLNKLLAISKFKG